MKRKPLIAIGILSVAVLIALGLFVRSNNHNSMSMSSADKTSLQSMMGVSSIDKLPLKTASNQKPLTPTVKDGVKEFTLTAEPIRWQYANGKTITAWAYNGQVPGPEIRVNEGDNVKVTFANKLPKATTIHWHGLNVPNNMDGVPGLTQDAVKPGASFTYEFTAGPAGTHFYHAHGSGGADEAQQLDMGQSGAFIVEPANYQKPDKEYTLVLDEWQRSGNGFNMAMQDMNMSSGMSMNYNLFTINGLSYPDTKSLDVKQGDKVRIRLVNAGTSASHPMHLHGHQFRIVATDGNPVPEAAQLTKNTINVSPGETYDIEFTADNPGVWAFHCHELHHAEGGMMTLLKYEGYDVPASRTNSDSTGNNSMMGHDVSDMPGM